MSARPLRQAMKRNVLGLLVAAALLGAGLATPVAGADHCVTKITVYSRSGLVGQPQPPATSGTLRACGHAVAQAYDDAVLLPKADQVLVRFHADLGPSYPTLPVVLDGLGFANQTFVMSSVRTAQGTHLYEMPGWESIPDATATGTLRATVVLPGGNITATYRTL